MRTQAVAKRYGQALLQIASEQNLIDRYQEELGTVVETITGSSELTTVWHGKEYDNGTKIKVVKELFSGKVSENIVNLLCVVVEKGREENIAGIFEMYKIYADEARNISYADVVSAYPLTAEQIATITTKLAQKTGKDVRLTTMVDPNLVGGMMVKFGDRVYDGTVTARLQGLKNKLQEVQF